MHTNNIWSEDLTDVTKQTPSGGNKGGGGGSSSAQFVEILNEARVYIPGGAYLLAAPPAIGSLPERPKTEAPRDDHSAHEQDTGRDRVETSRREDDRGEDRYEAPRRDDVTHRDTERGEDTQNNRAEARNDKHAKDDTARQAEDPGSASDGNQAENEGAEDTPSLNSEQTPDNTATAKAAEAIVSTPENDLILVTLAASAAGQTQTQTTPGPVQQVSAPAAQNTAAMEDPRQEGVHIGDRRPPPQATNTERLQAQPRGDQGQAQININTAGERNTTAARQAAQISKLVGEGNRISIQTQVTEESATLVSKPAATLTNGSTLSSSGKPAQPGTPPGQPGAPPMVGSQVNAQQTNVGQNQQAAAQAARQISAGGGAARQISAGGGAAKGPIQANPQTSGGEMQGTANTPDNPGNATRAQQPRQALAAHQTRFTLPGQAVTDQVNVQITKALKNGMDKINIQLKPAQLGRVNVSMELGHDGRVIAVVSADNKDTLELLQRDARDLERALQDAGFNMDQGSLSFNLRERQGEDEGSKPDGSQGEDDDLADGGSVDPNQPSQNEGGITADGRLDIRA